MRLARTIHSTILESPLPAKVIAKQLNKPYSTLLREINPYDDGAKLGIETLLQIMKITGDTAPLAFIANELGLELVTKTQNLRKVG
jgi:hypothetical protein